jgi:hypothetical protein
MDLVSVSELLCSPFYQTRKSLGKDSKGAPKVSAGQLVWAHVVYPTEKPQMLELVSLDRTDGAKSTFKIADYTAGSNPEFPVAELGLEDDEKFYILKGKRRQCIVLQTIRTRFAQPNSPEQYVWLVPRFRFKVRHTIDFQVKTAAFEIPSLFFTPSHTDGFDQSGAVRFELAQSVPNSAIEPMFGNGLTQKFLSPESWAVLQFQLYFYCSGGKVLDNGLSETIGAYRQIVLEEYAKYRAAQSSG